MSLTINRFGGGSGVSESNAILMVHAPTGSTVTASKGGVILTPKMWVSGSTVDEDVAMFIFSPAQFDSINPWTITATNGTGTDTASNAVLIVSNKEYEIELVFGLYIVHNGEIVTTPSFANATIGAKSGRYWYFGTTDSGYHAAYIRTDVTLFTVLTATIYSTSSAMKALGRWTQIAPAASDSMSSFTDMTSAADSTESTWTFNVSSLSGEQTVGVKFGGYGSYFGIKELALK